MKRTKKVWKKGIIWMTMAVCILLSAGCGGDSDDDSSSNGQPVSYPVPEPETVQEIAVEMDTALWDEVRHTARSSDVILHVCGEGSPESPYEYVPATVTVDGETLTDVGVRAKGWWGSINPTRPSLKIKFDEFVDGQELGGEIKRMTLNNNNQDSSRMHTYLAYEMYRKIGYPAPESGFAHLTVNGVDLGVYAVVEPIKKPFLRKWFDDDEGNLYEAHMSDFMPEAINSWERKTNEDTGDDRSDLEAVMTALDAADENLLAELGQVLDLDKFFTFWAMETLIAHWDGFNGDRNNCYLYNDPTTGKFVFIPWGPDSAFTPKATIFTVNSVGPLFANTRLSKRLYDHPEARALFIAKVAELYDLIWADTRYSGLIDAIQSTLQPFISSKFNPGFQSEISTLKSSMPAHAQDVFDSLIAPADLPDYPYEPTLRCWPSAPITTPFLIQFNTVWGRTEYPGAGGFTQFDVPGISFDPAFPQAYFLSVGPATDPPPGIDNVTFTFYQLIFSSETTGELMGLTLNLSPTQFLSGEPIRINTLANTSLRIYLPDFTDSDSVKMVGVVLDGELILDESGMNLDDPVSGTFSGEIAIWPPSTD